MDHNDLFTVLTNFSIGLYKLLGKDTEVVLYDLTKREIVYIANGELSGRDKSYKISPEISNAIISMADEDGHLIGYSMKSTPVDKLRSSHFIFYDAEEPVAMICVNQDTTILENFKDYLERMIRPTLGKGKTQKYDGENYIQKVTKQIIVDTMDNFSSAELATKEGRLKFLTALHKEGVFNVKDSIAIVCKSLNVSQTSMYNYLNELKENGTIITGLKL